MIENLRSIVKPEKQENDQVIRPQSLDEFIGQTEVVENLKVYLKAASLRKEPIDHILFSGAPGLGKTTLARLISEAQDGKMHQISAPNLKRAGDLAKLLTNLDSFDVLFIDEVHRLPTPVEEVLYTAMEDRVIDITLSEGMAASSVQLSLPPFTLVGATTRPGALSAPFRDRFGILLRLDYYNEDELKQILLRSSKVWSIDIQTQALKEIAQRSRKTPRVALRLLRRIWDYAIVNAKKNESPVPKDQYTSLIDTHIVRDSFEKMRIDSLGLTSLDNQLLTAMARDYQGGPVGLKPLSAVVSEDLSTLEDFVEPFLVRLGFLKRTSRGRMLTQAALEYIGMQSVFLESESPEQGKSIQKKSVRITANIFRYPHPVKNPYEIYIRRLSYQDAKRKLLREVESLFLRGVERVRIIHGVGEYVLRRMAIQELSGKDYVEIIEDDIQYQNAGQLEIRLLLPNDGLLRRLRIDQGPDA